MVPVAGGGPFVIAGVWPTVMVKACVATGATPLLAVTIPLNGPGTVGVPVIAPARLSESPVGSAPLVTLNVGAGAPVAE